MKKIKLTQNKVALVDDNDYKWLNQYKWHVHKLGSYFHARRNIRVNGKRKILIMSRDILSVSNSSIFVDHIDRNTLNNQRSNLRLSDRSQNGHNRAKDRNSKSKYLGVSKSSPNSWVARIQHYKVGEYIGSFKSEREAAIAYNKRATELHGEFASLNKI